jgi:hypothetical protein
MARTPKLEIYNFKLKPHKASEFKTFQDFINDNGIDVTKTKKDSTHKLFQYVISEIENGKEYEDKATEKKLRLFNKSKLKALNKGVSMHSENSYFEGIIGGGSYGIERIKIKTADNDTDELIEIGDTIYEPFYILLHTPLDSNKGLLFVQTYADEGISKTVRSFVRQIFSGDKYYNAEINAWYPKYLIDQCNAGKEIQKLIYTKTILQNRIATNPLQEEETEFTVKVIITPNSKNEFSKKNEKGLFGTFSEYAFKTKLGQFLLKDFKPQVSATTNEFKTPRIFDIDGKNELKPVILLENNGISINKKGTPDFEELKKFCIDLFEKIKPEFRNLNK